MDLANDKSNEVHKALYDNALQKLFNDFESWEDVPVDELEPNETIYDRIINILEIPGSEYWKPSSVIITFKKYDVDGDKKTPYFIKLEFNLSEYWDVQYSRAMKKSGMIMYDMNIPNDLEIIKYDYLRGKAIFKSRLEDIQYEVDFDDLHEYDVESDEVYLPGDAFIKQINLKTDLY